MADDRGVHEHVQRLGGERAERGKREPEDLAVVRRAPEHPLPRDGLAHARERGSAVDFRHGDAQELPFEDASFDHLTVTYLLRYVDDPRATLAELARVVRPGGVVASLEFGVPGGPARPMWNLYVDGVLPLAGRALQNGWREVGLFLGGSIRDFWARNPLERQLAWWKAAGLREVEVRRLSLGAAVVMWGTRG
jgi:demethylmenaquinone methyltransferase/2-methoxy-6-polyprenyl-1,4-benzoquinol methylase